MYWGDIWNEGWFLLTVLGRQNHPRLAILMRVPYSLLPLPQQQPVPVPLALSPGTCDRDQFHLIAPSCKAVANSPKIPSASSSRLSPGLSPVPWPLLACPTPQPQLV